MSPRRSARLSTRQTAETPSARVPLDSEDRKSGSKNAANNPKKRKQNAGPGSTEPASPRKADTLQPPQTPLSKRSKAHLEEEKPRLAEPRATNAPLKTPRGSRVVAFSSSPVKPSLPATQSQNENLSPGKKRREPAPDMGALHPPTSTTETLLKDACEHLCKVDPKLKDLIDRHHCGVFSPEGLSEVVDPFTALASGIIGQQVRPSVLGQRGCH